MKGMRYFTADIHFSHSNVIRYCNRPFATPDEMDEAMIARWNRVVTPFDTVYILGDVAFCSVQRAEEYIKRLHGRKILIAGNHDPDNGRFRRCFDAVLHEAVIKIGKTRVRMSHYPYAPTLWEKIRHRWHDDRYLHRRPLRVKGEILLHGHVHDRWQVRDNMINVGVDVWDWAPVSESKIANIIQGLTL